MQKSKEEILNDKFMIVGSLIALGFLLAKILSCFESVITAIYNREAPAIQKILDSIKS